MPSQHPDLLRIPLEDFQPLPGQRLASCLAYRTTKKVFGQERTIVITYNENLLEGQLQGIEASLTKARHKLDELQAGLRRRREGRLKQGRAPTTESIRKQVEQVLSGQFLKHLVRFEVAPGNIPTLSYRTDTAALARLMRTHLGKTILFTDNADWTNEEIVLGYRAQDRIESAFRDMKNPHFLGWSPMFHWTDSKIRVHAFYCVLALTLTSLLAAHPPSARAGFEPEPHDGIVGRHPRGVADLPATPGREASPHRHLPERARRRTSPSSCRSWGWSATRPLSTVRTYNQELHFQPVFTGLLSAF